METTMVCWLCIGIMEKNMETTMLYWSSILRLYWDNGKENGNYHSILGLY